MSDITRKGDTGEPTNNPGQFGSKRQAEADVTLLEVDDTVYEDLTYWDRVAVAKDPTTSTEMLWTILGCEAEDDFMHAVAGNPNANAKQIEQASQHYAEMVRRAALDNPNVATATIVRIQNDALMEELANREQIAAEGTNPGTATLQYFADKNSALAKYAGKKLAERR